MAYADLLRINDPFTDNFIPVKEFKFQAAHINSIQKNDLKQFNEDRKLTLPHNPRTADFYNR